MRSLWEALYPLRKSKPVLCSTRSQEDSDESAMKGGLVSAAISLCATLSVLWECASIRTLDSVSTAGKAPSVRMRSEQTASLVIVSLLRSAFATTGTTLITVRNHTIQSGETMASFPVSTSARAIPVGLERSEIRRRESILETTAGAKLLTTENANQCMKAHHLHLCETE